MSMDGDLFNYCQDLKRGQVELGALSKNRMVGGIAAALKEAVDDLLVSLEETLDVLRDTRVGDTPFLTQGRR